MSDLFKSFIQGGRIRFRQHIAHMLFLALTSSLVTLRCRRLLFSPLFFIVVALYVILIPVIGLDFWNLSVALSLRIWFVLCELLRNPVYQKLFFMWNDPGRADRSEEHT